LPITVICAVCNGHAFASAVAVWSKLACYGISAAAPSVEPYPYVRHAPAPTASKTKSERLNSKSILEARTLPRDRMQWIHRAIARADSHPLHCLSFLFRFGSSSPTPAWWTRDLVEPPEQLGNRAHEGLQEARRVGWVARRSADQLGGKEARRKGAHRARPTAVTG